MLVVEERLDDNGGETCERVLTGADDSGRIDASQHSLTPKRLNRVRRSLPGVLDSRLDETADLIEHVEYQLFLERGEPILIGAKMKRRQKAHIERTEIQRHAALVKA